MATSLDENDNIHQIDNIITSLTDPLNASRNLKSTIFILNNITKHFQNASLETDRWVKLLRENNVIPRLVRLSDVILRFESLCESVSRLLVEICSNRNVDIGQGFTMILTKSGGIMFALVSLKKYINGSAAVTYNASQLLWLMIQFLQRRSKNSIHYTNFVEQLPISDGDHPEIDKSEYSDLIQQLVLHGGASVLPKLMVTDFQHASSIENWVDCYKHIQCVKFMCLETTPAVIEKMVTADRGCVLMVCCDALMESIPICSDALVVVMGCLANCKAALSQVSRAGAWRRISELLGIEFGQIVVPKVWISKILAIVKTCEAADFAPSLSDPSSTQSLQSSLGSMSNYRKLKQALITALIKLAGYKEDLPNLYLTSKHSAAYSNGLQLDVLEQPIRTIPDEDDYDAGSTYFSRVGPDYESVSNSASISVVVDQQSVESSDGGLIAAPTSAEFADRNSDLFSTSSSFQLQSTFEGESLTIGTWSATRFHHKKKPLRLKPVARRLLEGPYGMPVSCEVLSALIKKHQPIPRFVPKALGGRGIARKRPADFVLQSNRPHTNTDSASLISNGSGIGSMYLETGVDGIGTLSLEESSRMILEKQDAMIASANKALLFTSRYLAEDLFADAPCSPGSSNFVTRLQMMTTSVKALDSAYCTTLSLGNDNGYGDGYGDGGKVVADCADDADDDRSIRSTQSIKPDNLTLDTL